MGQRGPWRLSSQPPAPCAQVLCSPGACELCLSSGSTRPLGSTHVHCAGHSHPIRSLLSLPSYAHLITEVISLLHHCARLLFLLWSLTSSRGFPDDPLPRPPFPSSRHIHESAGVYGVPTPSHSRADGVCLTAQAAPGSVFTKHRDGQVTAQTSPLLDSH